MLGNKNLNLSGLDKLNISGSEQFSEYNLPLLIKGIDTSNLNENNIQYFYNNERISFMSTSKQMEILSK